MEITSELSNKVLLISLAGSFHLGHTQIFDESYKNTTGKNISAIAVNFAKVEHIDSPAVGSLIRLRKHTKSENMDLVLLDLPKPVADTFRLACLDSIFTISTTAAFRKKYMTAAAGVSA